MKQMKDTNQPDTEHAAQSSGAFPKAFLDELVEGRSWSSAHLLHFQRPQVELAIASEELGETRSV